MPWVPQLCKGDPGYWLQHRFDPRNRTGRIVVWKSVGTAKFTLPTHNAWQQRPGLGELQQPPLSCDEELHEGISCANLRNNGNR